MNSLLIDGTEQILRRTSLSTSGGRDERWLQELLFRQPELIPIGEIDPGAGCLIPICRELPLPREGGNVFLDLLCVTPHGRLVLVECKLWRNPQARREVIGQILEYAALLRYWSYGDLTVQLKKKLNSANDNPLFDHVLHHVPHAMEATFVDAVSKCLAHGDFDLIIAGDGIRTDLQAIGQHLESRAGHAVRLALVEFRIWEDGSGRALVVPSVPARTEIIPHRVVVDQTGMPLQISTATDREEATVEAIVEPERAARRDLDRAFWQRFIDNAKFDHPDQPRPSHGSRNSVRLAMPAPARWVTAYRTENGRTGLFLTLQGDTGEAVWLRLQAEQPALETEIGAPVRFKMETQTPFLGQLLINRPVKDGNDAAQMEWLIETSNRTISAVRPRISPFSAET